MYRLVALIVLALLAAAPTAQAQIVYFLVAEIEPSRNDSYVLGLDDPWDIDMARMLLGIGGTTIVVADIAPWEQNGINLNRNYLDPNVPSWSWYVAEFIEFAMGAAEYCDGWPTAVEEGFFAGNRICFWGYTLVAELGANLDPWCYVLERDCAVDWYDVDLLTSNWLQSGCEYPEWCGGSDLNVSGEVDFIDFAILAEEWLLGN